MTVYVMHGVGAGIEWGSDRSAKIVNSKGDSFKRLAGNPKEGVQGGRMAHSLRSLGSAALNYCMVAQGGMDLYWCGHKIIPYVDYGTHLTCFHREIGCWYVLQIIGIRSADRFPANYRSFCTSLQAMGHLCRCSHCPRSWLLCRRFSFVSPHEYNQRRASCWPEVHRCASHW